MNWTNDYIGIPFVDGGRTFDGCDCWGLVRLIFEKELDITLPQYGEISSSDMIRISEKMKAGRDDAETWLPVLGDAKQFDVVVMAWTGRKSPGHVGVAVDARRLIHVEKGINTSMVPFSHYTVKHRVLCLRRHRNVA
jgi:cell wall-associated NlpC family hydrolase